MIQTERYWLFKDYSGCFHYFASPVQRGGEDFIRLALEGMEKTLPTMQFGEYRLV